MSSKLIVDTIEDSTGTYSLALGSGNSTFPGGIHIGGTGSANLLDDYEEGTWTATLSDATSGGNTTTTDTDARYTKIGNVVYFQCDFPNNVDVTGMTSTNQLYIQGLPFTSGVGNNSRLGNVDLRNVTYTSGRVPIGLLGESRSFLYFIETGSGISFAPLQVQDYSNGDSIFVSGHYYTDA